jgi:branched-chain amino acid transporter azlD
MNNNLYLFLSILSAGVGMVICRLLPFIIFANGKLPKLVKFYEKYLPYSLMAILFCYCFVSVKFSVYPHGFPEIITLIVITLLHIWKKNVMLSLFLGTVVFLILSRFF